MVNKKDIRNWVIYKIVNPKGRIYIGRTCNFRRRLYEYKSGKSKHDGIVTNSIKKYGFNSHDIEIIDSFKSDLRYANGKEIFWIRTYCSNRHKYLKNGMNCTDGGGGSLGKIWSEESINKLKETKRKNPRIFTSEERRKISERMKGHKYTKPGKPPPLGWVEKMREINTGKKYLLGRKRPREVVERQAAKLRGKERPQYMKQILLENGLKQARAVCQYDIYGNFIGEYVSIKEAARYIGCGPASISSVLGGRTKTAYGFIFTYKCRPTVAT